MKLERAWLFVASFGLAAVPFVGCGTDPNPQGSTSSSSASSGEAGAGGSGGSGGASSSTGGGGGTPECTVAADCKNNGPVDFCGEPECVNGKCNRKGLTAPGTALPSQLYGDCQVKECDNTFNMTSVADDKDAYDDAKECTTDMCTNGVLTNDAVVQGTLCTQPNGSGGVCNGSGACVSCIDGVQGCTGAFVCQMNACVNMKCTNGIKDPGESDIDCGAVGCALCADGKICTNLTQCKSGVCTGGTCTAPTCSDVAKNGNETGFDCGGADCSKCPTDEGCVTANDCQSGVCKAGVCLKPTCLDAVQNGDETGIDSGGCCPDSCL